MVEIYRGDLSRAALGSILSRAEAAVDIETNGLDPLHSQPLLVQIHDGIRTYIVHLEPGRVPLNMVNFMESTGILKVFHHAPFDLSFMVHHWKIRPANIACTKVAARIVYPCELNQYYSLKSLLKSQLDVDISKELQVSDWSRELLSPEQIEYAAADVQYLLPLVSKLMSRASDLRRDRLVHSSWEFLPRQAEIVLLGIGDVFSH